MKVLKLLSRKQKITFTIIIAVSIVSSALASIWPVMLSKIYDGVSTGSITNVKTGLTAILSFGVAFVFTEVLTIARRVWVDILSASFEKTTRDISIKKLLKLNTKFFGTSTSGEYTAKINQSVAGTSQLIKVICNNVVPSILISIFTIGQIVSKSPKYIAIILASYILIEMAIAFKQIASQNGIREELIAKKAKLDGEICQSIQNIELIRVTNAESYEFNRISPRTENIRKTEKKHHIYMGSFDSLKQIIKTCYTVGLILFSVYLASKGVITNGMVITIALLFQQLVVPIDAIHVFIDEIASSKIKAKELIKLLDQKEDRIYNPALIDIDKVNGDIIASNVNVFAPDGNTIICNNASVRFVKGKVNALLGPTGCGKSSFLKAIMRYFPSIGEISLGNISQKAISQKSLCKNIYYVTQESIFFEGSLRDNLVYGLDYIPADEQLLVALKKVQIYDELNSKNKNILDISVSEKGSNFSGGQKQRLALARAFLRQPEWFFLDESTAALDLATTGKVLDNLENYAKTLNAGIVYISHQPEVIARCEVVNDIEKFKLVA